MEMKDIAVELESMESVRGGNAIVQNSVNGPVTGAVAVSGGGFNLSPVTVSSLVGQSNSTTQQALIEDHDIYSTSVEVVGSQIFAGFPFGGRSLR
ncbi:MAG: hypothetical protein ACR2PZ_13185 [Pseudomonadales bacterium]